MQFSYILMQTLSIYYFYIVHALVFRNQLKPLISHIPQTMTLYSIVNGASSYRFGFLTNAFNLKKFVELCLYQQCLIFLAVMTNLVNTNVLMIQQKAHIFVLKCALLSL